MLNYGSYRNEYLVTNNFGSYSSSNLLYGNTRKYHGLLVATQDSLFKFNVLNRVIDSYRNVVTELPLSTNIYQNEYLDPNGFNFLKDFAFYPNPSWRYNSDSVEIVKKIFLSKTENSVTLNYKFNTTKSGFFNLKPLLNFRDIHTVNSQITTEAYDLEDNNEQLKIDLKNNNQLNIYHPGSKFYEQKEIYYQFYYPDEDKRGYLSTEDLLQPGYFEIVIPEGVFELNFTFSYNTLSKHIVKDFYILESGEIDSDNEEPLSEFKKYLEKQAPLFVNTTTSHNGICAGYHWFDEWSRDTFIALPGLSSNWKDRETAEKTFREWGEQLKTGLLPNRLLFTDLLNSLDSIFWFVTRLYKYSTQINNFDLAESLLPNLESVLNNFQNKTHNIDITHEGFLYDNNSTDALTWMDAKVDDKPVIDRSGMAVEIQALWYNYIRIMINLKERLNDRTHLTLLKDLKVSIEKNFENIFWNHSQNCLYDCVRKDYIDKSVRPNQVIATYLPFKILGNRKNKMILATVEQKLLTSVGLRTLAREDSNFRETYSGDQKNRDLSYHQGTIWPFLLGFYLSAYYEVYLKSRTATRYVSDRLLDCFSELKKQQLNYVPEVFNASDLSPQGCLAQAWSVALLLETIYHLEH